MIVIYIDFLGGSYKLPQGLPQSYYFGFQGCIDRVQVDNRDLNLITHGDTSNIKFCDSVRLS